MFPSRLNTIALVSVISGMIYGCQKSSNDSNRIQNNGASEDDFEAVAIMLVSDDLENKDLAGQVQEDGVEKAIKAKKEKLQKSEDAAVQKDGSEKASGEKPDKELKVKKLNEAKAKFDTNGDGKIDATEREAMKASLKAKIEAAKSDGDKSWAERKDEICQKVKDKVAEIGEEVKSHPMYDRVIAHCEGAEMPEKGSIMSNSGDICSKVKQMFASQEKPSKGLTAIAEKCNAGTFGGEAKSDAAADKGKDNAAKEDKTDSAGKSQGKSDAAGNADAVDKGQGKNGIDKAADSDEKEKGNNKE
ncbi:MAG: hypothetical protein HQK54_08740 [Oligoflexales bacterium]|nr:hypothetical protein [Oligoflexales bacterium]